MDSNGFSLRKLATVLGVSQPFLSQIRAGKRLIPEALRTKVEALGAYHLLITPAPISSDKQTAGGLGGGAIKTGPKGQSGDPPRGRTGNLRIKSPLLCQLS